MKVLFRDIPVRTRFKWHSLELEKIGASFAVYSRGSIWNFTGHEVCEVADTVSNKHDTSTTMTTTKASDEDTEEEAFLQYYGFTMQN